jgi:muramoyltetrapeptide carboxypeptidase LdcA involved in peptidoglycan recycling
MGFIKPERLRKGDTVAIISPSWGGASVFPHIYESGIETLKSWGLKIKEYPTARADADKIYHDPKMRADDINNAFKDLEVKAIITTIGGDDSVRILPYLDPEAIKNNPKILLGYSDTTTLTTYCNQLGLVTLNGPSIMAGLSQWKSLPKEFQDHVFQFLFDPQESYQYIPFKQYSNGYLDWSKKENVGKIKDPVKTEGWKWLQGNSVTKGNLFGGCIEVMEFMKSTKFWPKEDYWNNKILFLETSEDKPSPEQIKLMLRNYGMQGIYDKISGLLIGRARDYTEEEKKELYENITKVVSKEFGKSDLPVIANLDFGHTDPQYILPLGVEAEINCEKKIFRLLESPLK